MDKLMNSIEKYREETKEKLKQLFKEAEEKDSEKFLRALLAIDTERYKKFKIKTISYTSDEEFQELCHLLNDFHEIAISDKVEKNTRTKMRLFLYCHILEADLPYMITANIARILAGEPYNSRIYLTTQKGKNKTCKYPWQKIRYLSDLGKKVGVDLSSIWNRFFCRELRNAFSHSQYCLRNREGDVFLTPAVSPTTLPKKKLNKEFYTYEEVEDLYLAAYSFLEVFIEITKQYMAKYKNGNYHSIGHDIGPVQFDLNRKRWGF